MAGAGRRSSPETVHSSPSQARVATNVAGPPTRRTFAIVFDDMHVGDVDMEQAKSAVSAFMERQARRGDGRGVAEPRLKLLTSSRAGESHESEWSLQVTLGPSLPESGDALWHPFVTRIAMSPGDHRARLVVESGDRLGSVTVDFVVPPLGEERLSTPILSDRLVANASGRRLLSLAHPASTS